MAQDTASLAKRLGEVLGYHGADVEAVCEMDPVIAEHYIALAKATSESSALDPKTRCLINIALSASVADLKEAHTRIHIANALREGATHEEIIEVLQLTSVLGIHGFIPGTQLLLEAKGGLEAIKRTMTAERIGRAEAAKAEFAAARGAMSPIWEANCYLSPRLMVAYAAFSGAPWKTSALSPKVKEFVYFAIDLAPSHLELTGARIHLGYAINKYGATVEEITAVLELIALVGFQTQLLALPILKQELAKG